MLVSYFKKSYLIQYVIILILAFLLWGFTFFFPSKIVIDNVVPGPLYHFIKMGVIKFPLLTGVFAFLVLLMQAYVFNSILVNNNIITKNSVLGMFIYTVFMSFNFSFNYLSPTLIVNAFILIILYQTFMIYQNPQEYQLIFNLGFITSIASLFYFPAIFLLLFIWISFIFFRMVNWREWVIVFCGVITPFLFFSVYLFWTEGFSSQIADYKTYFTQIGISDFYLDIALVEASIYIAGMLFIIYSIFHLLINFFDQTILLRRNMSAVIVLFFTTFLIFIFNGGVSIQITVIPSSILVSFILSRSKRTLLEDTLIILFILLIFLNNILIILN